MIPPRLTMQDDLQENILARVKPQRGVSPAYRFYSDLTRPDIYTGPTHSAA